MLPTITCLIGPSRSRHCLRALQNWSVWIFIPVNDIVHKHASGRAGVCIKGMKMYFPDYYHSLISIFKVNYMLLCHSLTEQLH